MPVIRFLCGLSSPSAIFNIAASLETFILSDSLSADTLALPDSLINDSLKQTMPVDSILLQDSVKSMDMPAGGRHQGSPIDYKRKRKR